MAENGGGHALQCHLAPSRNRPELALLPLERIVAFGSKAKAAMKRLGHGFIGAHALAPRNLTTARASWSEALRELSRLDARARQSGAAT